LIFYIREGELFCGAGGTSQGAEDKAGRETGMKNRTDVDPAPRDPLVLRLCDPIPISIVRQESGFDRACDSAFRMAVAHCGVGEDGHSRVLDKWERSDSWIELLFVGYKRISSEHVYEFSASAFKQLEDDE
jgi:hypothetical protein